MFKWIQLALEQWKTIMSILVLLGVSGVSIYGNVNEINPWKPTIKVVEEEVEILEKEILTPEPQIKIIEKTIETRVESGITKLQVDAAIEAFMTEHIREYH